MAFWYKVISLFPLSCHRIISYFDIKYFFVCKFLISLFLKYKATEQTLEKGRKSSSYLTFLFSPFKLKAIYYIF